METENNLNQSDPKHPSPSEEIQLDIETVTPETEKNTPDTQLPGKKDGETPVQEPGTEHLDDENSTPEQTDEAAKKEEANIKDTESEDVKEEDDLSQEETEEKQEEGDDESDTDSQTDEHGIETVAP